MRRPPGGARVTASLFIVRGRQEGRYYDGRPVRSEKRFLLEGVFTSRDQAEAFQAEREKQAAASGDFGPLIDCGGIEELMGLSAFDPGVFRDWLTDHGLATYDPAAFA